VEKPGIMGHACNPALRRLSKEDYQFEASWSYIVRPCLKTVKSEMEVNPSPKSNAYTFRNQCFSPNAGKDLAENNLHKSMGDKTNSNLRIGKSKNILVRINNIHTAHSEEH
jgi:hypothetical protein